MSYHRMSNREGNQKRIMEMYEANLPPIVIAAYMTNWNVPMSEPDVQGVINTYESMGTHAVKKSDVQHAIENHQRIEQFKKMSPVFEDDHSEVIGVDFDEQNDV